ATAKDGGSVDHAGAIIDPLCLCGSKKILFPRHFHIVAMLFQQSMLLGLAKAQRHEGKAKAF
uniref:hypothetical protein n=1 Tax=uncultured Endozoicomonas sp. TaxID=432652 RepID=UPI00261F58C2